MISHDYSLVKSANWAKSSVHSLNLGWKVNEYIYFHVHVSIMKVLSEQIAGMQKHRA